MILRKFVLTATCLTALISLTGCTEELEGILNPPENCKILFIELPLLCDYD